MITREIALARAQQIIASQKLDALVVASPWNVRYLAGTYFLTQKVIPDRLALVVVTPNAEPSFIYCSIEDASAQDESWLDDLRGYTEFVDRPMHVLADQLRARGIATGRIGIETDYLVSTHSAELRAELPQADFVAAQGWVDKARMIKTPEEIAWLGKTTLATDAAIRAAFAATQIGEPQFNVGDRMVAHARRSGADGLQHLVLATGDTAFKVHAVPDITPLKAGVPLRVDFGMTWHGYLSDIARTAFLAPLQPRQADTYRRLEAVQQTVIASLRAGTRACDAYALCAKAYASQGLPFGMPHIGHSIGLVLHEKPMLHPRDETVLMPGMVFMVEPAVVAHDGVYHTEDMVEITEGDPRVLSRSADWAEPMEIGG